MAGAIWLAFRANASVSLMLVALLPGHTFIVAHLMLFVNTYYTVSWAFCGIFGESIRINRDKRFGENVVEVLDFGKCGVAMTAGVRVAMTGSGNGR